ncbi:BsuBI/PstI family type II restriction endonuclease [Pollutimonas sp. M17]|uniref:BsuBI/PstI family type II restriction endonuclease n=1 Tax=Pollutimonas sp. M17 TaxID=2962065 RepID=UPI0021F3D9D8|nr:BsuBI/PstI family type II restriction endonuclease [Pollutimonas sp. M17]UYO92960.1 restriction endonuclease [Pollutimonas sp. M17]
MTWPAVPALSTVTERLPLIFPEGVENRQYCIRESTAKTVLTMIYCGAIHGSNRWIRPSQVVDMSDTQLALSSHAEREAWCVYMHSNKKKERSPKAWYAVNSREQIRDENIARGLIPNQAVIERPGIPTTSSRPKYALQPEFSALFDESIQGEFLAAAISDWQLRFLSAAAMARATIIRNNAVASTDRVPVVFPSGSAITLAPGESSRITKAVVEQFSRYFLVQPAVLWLSESANKVIDPTLVHALHLHIDQSKSLPDVILVDLSPASGDILVVFVEVVHTDGPISQQRKEALEAIALEAGFETEHLAYVTAFSDRSASPYRGLAHNLAWDSFVWFASEPVNIIMLRSDSQKKLSQLR